MAPMIVFVVLVILIVFFILYKKPDKKIILPKDYKNLLKNNVPYYNRLDEKNKIRFEEKIKEFLGYVRIDGIDTEADAFDKLLVASSAIIPVFGFEKWKYYNLKNVLLYPASFNKDEFLATGYEKNTLGMIGNGPMQRVMILSKPALHYGFQKEAPKENTGIHEFVHLLDKEDGEVDGLPEALLNRKYNSIWIELVNKNIASILNGQSDINYYAATNRAEFFAVASEYFFNCPQLLKENHPELFLMMCKIFNQDPLQPGKLYESNI
jgi:Mlc titration factor MtfA (ptsG expression regulator)